MMTPKYVIVQENWLIRRTDSASHW